MIRNLRISRSMTSHVQQGQMRCARRLSVVSLCPESAPCNHHRPRLPPQPSALLKLRQPLLPQVQQNLIRTLCPGAPGAAVVLWRACACSPVAVVCAPVASRSHVEVARSCAQLPELRQPLRPQVQQNIRGSALNPGARQARRSCTVASMRLQSRGHPASRTPCRR